MKVEITLRVTNKVVNAIAQAMEPTIETISQYDSTISFETDRPNEWLSIGRKEAFEKKYNEEMGNEELYFIVEKIAVTN